MLGAMEIGEVKRSEDEPRPDGEVAPAEAVNGIDEEVSKRILNLPNSLTFFRVFLVPFLVVALLTEFEAKEYVGLGIFLLAAVTDLVDGWIARRFNQITRLGMLLDPIADKLLISAAFISLVALGLASAWMVVVIIGREFAISGLRSVAAQQGIDMPASKLGKGKTVSQVIAISLLILGEKLGELQWLGPAVLWVVVILAIVSAVDYVWRFYSSVLAVK